MANLKQAPKLQFSSPIKNTKQYYHLPQDIMDTLFRTLGTSPAQLRIMIVLLGTKEGFLVSEKWICERTGLNHSSYIKARKGLIDKGYIELDPSKSITVNLSKIKQKGFYGDTPQGFFHNTSIGVLW